MDLTPNYDGFRHQLQQSLPKLSPTGDELIDVALTVLRTAGGTVCDVDSALDILVDNAIEEFGFAPRDVYNGVLNLSQTRDNHKEALEGLNYPKLQAIITAFRKDHLLERPSHRVVVVYPEISHPRHEEWKIAFKSILISKRAEELMKSEELENLRDTYDYFRTTPEASILAGWGFEAMGHRLLFNGWRGPTPLRMETNLRDPPTFSIKPPQPPNTSLPSLEPLPADASVVTVNFADGVGDVTLDNGKYYKAAVTNNPLFDSFTINYYPSEPIVSISIFQMTISPDHKGSPKGYDIIRKIKESVEERLRIAHSSARVKVAYFLVCPGTKTRYT